MGFAPLLMAVGTGISAVGQINAGKSANVAAGINAKIKESQADYEVQAAGAEAQRSAQRFRRFAGGQRADIASQGGQVASGTGLLLAERAARENMLDQMNLATAGTNRAKGLRIDAGMTRYEGRRAQADGLAGGLGTAIRGIGQYAQQTGKFGMGG